jgi:hypothetical protein
MFLLSAIAKRNLGGWLQLKITAISAQQVLFELGASPEQKKAFYGVSQKLKISEDDSFVYLEPRLEARVKIRNWSRKGFLRSPVFIEFAI